MDNKPIKSPGMKSVLLKNKSVMDRAWVTLDSAVRQGLSEKETFKAEKEIANVRPCKELGKNVPEKGTSQCKGLMEGAGLLYSRIRRNGGMEQGGVPLRMRSEETGQS